MIMFDGVPKVSGIYEFKIFLEVKSIDGVQLCNVNTASKEYTLQIK